jgi:hypothetical protein
MGKIPGKGATLNLQINSTYEPIAHGIEMTPWSGTNTAIDTTILTSSAQRHEATAIPSYGECSWTGFLDKTSTTQTALATAFSDGNATNAYRINFADTDTSAATFVGPVVGYAPTGVVQDQMVQVQFTIAIDGAVTFTT